MTAIQWIKPSCQDRENLYSQETFYSAKLAKNEYIIHGWTLRKKVSYQYQNIENKETWLPKAETGRFLSTTSVPITRVEIRAEIFPV